MTKGSQRLESAYSAGRQAKLCALPKTANPHKRGNPPYRYVWYLGWKHTTTPLMPKRSI